MYRTRNGLRTQVTEAKEGPLEIRRKREARRMGQGVEEGPGVLHRNNHRKLNS